MSAELPLLPPDSPELVDLLPSQTHVLIYGYLYERRNNPPTMVEVEEMVEGFSGARRSQTGRRLRDLRKWFHIPLERSGSRSVYVLKHRLPTRAGEDGISPKIRGEVLSSQRCAQCGKTPSEDHVKLEVDHKIPRSWGGTDGIDNLQPLCVQCNHDKQAFFATMSPFEEHIKAAAKHEEPHRRIGELLKAFSESNVEVPSQVVGAVASMHQYQEDWQKRMRELRVLGWDYVYRKERIDGRVQVFYRLTKYSNWPEGSIVAEIRRRENLRSRGS